MNDAQAGITGYATWYSSHTVGFLHYFSKNIRVRPEVRYERAYKDGVTPYDNGTKKDQYTAAMDLLVRF